MLKWLIELSLEGYSEEARNLVSKLEGKLFDIVSFHSRFNQGLVVLEERSLKSSEILIQNTLIKIPLNPHRSISFDATEDIEIIYESDRQIRIVRKMASGDTVTRIILINGKIEET